MHKIFLLLFLSFFVSAKAYENNATAYLQASVGDGRSYENGAQAVGFFTTHEWYGSKEYLWIDCQLMRVDLGRFASSYGIGWRSCSFGYLETFGVNFFYDTRRDLKKLFSQFGIGIELFSHSWEVRCNGYLPFGRKDAFELSDSIDYVGGYFAHKKQYQSAMWGFDFEIGKEICLYPCLTLYAGVGPYFYNTFKDSACGSNAIFGGLFRTLACWKYFAVELFVSHDPFYCTTVQGEFTLSLPLNWCCQLLYPQLKALRNRIILTRKTCNWITNY